MPPYGIPQFVRKNKGGETSAPTIPHQSTIRRGCLVVKEGVCISAEFFSAYWKLIYKTHDIAFLRRPPRRIKHRRAESGDIAITICT